MMISPPTTNQLVIECMKHSPIEPNTNICDEKNVFNVYDDDEIIQLLLY